jgi:hypothetical protein
MFKKLIQKINKIVIIHTMFDLIWYKKIFNLISDAIKSTQICFMNKAQFKSESSKIKDYNQVVYQKCDIINISLYLNGYLSYFNLEFKEKYYTEMCNNNHVWI